MKQKTYEALSVGDEFVSYGRTVTETDVVLFTSLAGLKLPIFIDEEFCREHTPFKTRIVPGLLIQAFAAGMMDDVLGPYTIAALGFGETRFFKPAIPGDTLRTHARVVSKRDTSDGTRGILTVAPRVVNQRGEAVMETTYTLMMRKGESI